MTERKKESDWYCLPCDAIHPYPSIAYKYLGNTHPGLDYVPCLVDLSTFRLSITSATAQVFLCVLVGTAVSLYSLSWEPSLPDPVTLSTISVASCREAGRRLWRWVRHAMVGVNAGMATALLFWIGHTLSIHGTRPLTRFIGSGGGL